MQVNQRNHAVDLLRGIAALCMILGHSFIVHPVNISGVMWCAVLKQIIYTFHMELFFILAGWVYRCKDYLPFLQKKAKRLLIPYIVFGIASLILHTFGGDAVNGNASLSSGILSLLLYGGDYWFIYTMFILLAIYPFLSKLFKYTWTKPIAIFVILLLNNIINWPPLFTISAVMKYLPYFILGDWIGKCTFEEKVASTETRFALFLGGLMIYTGIYVLEFLLEVQIGHIFAFIRAVALCAALYVICDIKIHHSTIITEKLRALFENASRYSLQLYLFNGYILTVIRIVLCSVMKVTSPALIVSGIWIGNIVITLFVCKVILPKSKLLRFLCGT